MQLCRISAHPLCLEMMDGVPHCRRHHVDIAILQALIHLLAAHEAREVEAVGDAALCCEIDHLFHHIARASKAEAHVTCAMQHHIGSLDEVFRTLLHGDTTEEGHHLLLARVVGTRNVLKLLLQGINGVVHGEALARILMILVDDRLASELRYAHDAIGVVHTLPLTCLAWMPAG